MRKRSPEVSSSSSSLFFTGYFYGICALAGFCFALAVFALLSFGESLERERHAEVRAKRALGSVREMIGATWERASYWVEQAAWQLGAADKESLPLILAQYQRLWPEAGFTLYDHSAMPLPVAGGGGALSLNMAGVMTPGLPGVKKMVLSALDGEITRGYTQFRGFLSLGVAAPVQGKQVRAVVISVPLDSFFLSRMKTVLAANVAVIPFDAGNNIPMGDISGAGNTFTQPGENLAGLWAELVLLLKKTRLAEGGSLLLREDTFFAGLEPLMDASQAPVGLLLVAPSQKMTEGIPLWHFYAALAAGLLGGLLMALCLRFRERRMAAAIAGDLYLLSRDEDAQPRNTWPVTLESAFRKMGNSLKEYRILLKNAARDNKEPQEESRQDDGTQKSLDAGEYQRLFDSLPIGAFQATTDGRLLRVNSAFAMLLGYDSPMYLLTECASFTDVCLYGDSIRNPLSIIMEQGSGRHILSLRRRDGKVRHFSLICAVLTSEKGDQAGILEGFLLDRELEEQIARVGRESEYAKQQRESLALLLAATCRQTQSYFMPPQAVGAECPPGQDRRGSRPEERLDALAQAGAQWADEAAASQSGSPDEGENGDEERLERRKSVLSAKAVLSDIYQIAMTEVEGAAPVDVPMDFRNFMKRLCRQALPTMFARGISLRCEIAEELLMRLSGPAPLLRHALLRALLAVTGPVQGGWACLSVSRDPNAPRSAGVSRLLFSASWSYHSPESGAPYPLRLGSEHIMNAGETGYVAFMAEAPPAGTDHSTQILSGALDIASEQSVIRYLAQKMRGSLLEGVFTTDLRSLQLIVPLEHVSDGAVPERGQSPASLHSAMERKPDVLIAYTEDKAVDSSPATGQKTQTAVPELKLTPVTLGAAKTLEAVGEIEAADVLGTSESFALSRQQAVAEAAGLTEEPQPSSLNLLVMDGDAVAEGYAADTVLDEGSNPAQIKSLDILLIDANLNNRLLFSMFLRDTRHRITEAHDGQEGVEAFQRGHYDVIFMDMEMPLMDGYQATRIIRALEADTNQPPTPIVGMTTYALPELRRECMLSGCTEFLSRPFSKNALFTLLKAIAGLNEDAE